MHTTRAGALMLFNSFQYALFFPVVAAVYFALPHRARWAWLLAASYVFYMAWKPGYAALLLSSTLVNYAAGLGMGAAHNQAARRAWLLLSLAASLGLLFFFKYYAFFGAQVRPLTEWLGWPPLLPEARWVLPVGISFYTFQVLSYSIEVYRRRQAPERHPGRFALYVAFFPQLVAGPIERAQRLLPQLAARHDFDYRRVTDGLTLMVWGLFQKVVIADRLAPMVNHVYGAPERCDGPVLVFATVLFAYQIYCDFAGYTNIALGTAEVFGVKLMDNFRRPYFAVSTADFWRRWHISLSTWFRDYLYIPLGGNRVAAPRWTVNILIVFLLSGLWHGAAWTFVLWGLLHGLYLVAGRLLRGLRARAAEALGLARRPVALRLLQTGATFLLVTFAWIFFRAASIDDAVTVVSRLGTGWNALVHPSALADTRALLGAWPREVWLAVALVIFLECVHAVQAQGPIRPRLRAQPLPVRWLVYSAGLWAIFLFGVLKQQEFIYFVF